MSDDRRVLVVTHTGREAALAATAELTQLLHDAGITPLMESQERNALPAQEREKVVGLAVEHKDLTEHLQEHHAELVVVLGGDGTILRGAELVRGTKTPLLGVNLGRVGFLADRERDGIADAVARIASRDYDIDERMTLDVDVIVDGERISGMWAINEASIEKVSRENMIETVLEVDGRPVTEFGCDGVVLATPTGSTAYSFSAGGPVVWPDVEALIVAPISAHALFARPLVVSPNAVPAVELLPGRDAILWCDGRRSMDIPGGARIEVRRSSVPIRLARMSTAGFADRLVAKFGLPVRGWRGRSQR